MLKTDLINIANLPNRERKAKQYSNSISTKEIKKTEKESKVIFAAFMILILLIIISAKVYANGNTEYTYARAKGNGYEYVTEVSTEIKSVDFETNRIFISYKGNEYSYISNGNVDVSKKIIVVFNEDMKIVDVK